MRLLLVVAMMLSCASRTLAARVGQQEVMAPRDANGCFEPCTPELCLEFPAAVCSAANASVVTRLINAGDCERPCHNTRCRLCKRVELSTTPGRVDFVCGCPRTGAHRDAALAFNAHHDNPAERRHYAADEL